MRFAISIGPLCLTMALAGCATIVNGSTQVIPVTSNPRGAAVTIDNSPVGVTPLLATVSRKQSHVVSITYDSFPSVRIPLERHVSPWVLGDLMLYIVPVIADVSNGSAYAFATDTVRANFAAPGVARDDTPRLRRGTIGNREIPPGSRVAVGVYSGVLGFGAGHKMVGADGRRFRIAQLGGLAAFVGGLWMGMAGQSAGVVPFYGGAAVFMVSRVSEVADVVNRPVQSSANTPPR